MGAPLVAARVTPQPGSGTRGGPRRLSIYRLATRRGGWRLAVAILGSAATLVFGIGIALGQFTIAIAALVLVGLTSALLFKDLKRAASG
jgi:hypothetical protein